MADTGDTRTVAEMLLVSAQQDLAACVLLVNASGIGDAIVGFHAQQSIEKSLKAVLSAKAVEFRRTHDLLTLLDLLEDHGLPPPPFSDWLDELNPYAVEARYGTIDPSGLDRPLALQVAREVLAWATSQMEHRSGSGAR